MEREIPRFPQLAKEPLLKSTLRPQFQNRAWAKMLDFTLIQTAVFISSWIHVLMGFVIGAGLWSLVDCLGRGQSPGKWLLGLHTVDQKRAVRPGLYQSFVRNLPFFFLTMSLFHSTHLGRAVTLLSVAWIAGEVYFIRSLKSGLRMGDVLGGTRVFEYKDEHTKFIEQFLKEEDVL